MKTKVLFIAATLAGATALSTQAGVGIGINIGIPAPPPVVVAPAVTVTVPDSYVWDGYENVGVVNGAYFYLGPGNVWLSCGPTQLARFHGWEGHHPDWRTHAIRNDRYRKDAHGHVAPMGHGPDRGHAQPMSHDDRGHDKDHGP